MTWLIEGGLRFSPAAFCVEQVHRGDVGADYCLCGPDDSLKRFPLSLGGVAKPRRDAAGENSLNGSSELMAQSLGLRQQPLWCFLC